MAPYTSPYFLFHLNLENFLNVVRILFITVLKLFYYIASIFFQSTACRITGCRGEGHSEKRSAWPGPT